MRFDLSQHKLPETKFETDNGTYQGQLDAQDRKEGFGKYEWKDGSSYLGFWVGDKANGLGRLTTVDGEIYEGYF